MGKPKISNSAVRAAIYYLENNAIPPGYYDFSSAEKRKAQEAAMRGALEAAMAAGA